MREKLSDDEAAVRGLCQQLVDGRIDKLLEGTRLTGRIESVKFLGPDVVLVVTRGESEPSLERGSMWELMAVREGDEWRLAALGTSGLVP